MRKTNYLFILFCLFAFGCEKAPEENLNTVSTNLTDTNVLVIEPCDVEIPIESAGLTLMPGETIRIFNAFVVSEPCEINDIEISFKGSFISDQTPDGSTGAFEGGDYDLWQERVQREKQHPESYLTGADLAIYNKLLELEAQIKELQKKD